MLSKGIIISIIIGYFIVLVAISFLTSLKVTKETFFTGDKSSKWYLVAFGMVGASLSGITFISIPGLIADSAFTYMQMAIGYVIGYIVIAFVLLPLYYRLNVTSIYEFLGQRFGQVGQKLGASYFLLSRVIGASLRMYLVANVLQLFVFDAWGVPYFVTVTLSIALIYLYSFRGGIKTIIWTDTLQTLFMLISLGLTLYLLHDSLNLESVFGSMEAAGYTEWFQVENADAGNYWWKGIIGGMLITIGMTGLDQDMMQKNLTCKNIKEAKRNMLSFSVVLFFVNLAFLILGGMLYLYLDSHPEIMSAFNDFSGKGDDLFPYIALKGGLGISVGVFFLLGLIAAAYSSADSALTSLTTSFCIDIVNLKKYDEKKQKSMRLLIHLAMSVVLIMTIMIFYSLRDNESIVWTLFKAAGYTYGPLLGLFMFGIVFKRKVHAAPLLLISIIVPVIVYLCTVTYGEIIFGDFQFGHIILGINGLITFLMLLVFSRGQVVDRG